jgi:hypothetical protein
MTGPQKAVVAAGCLVLLLLVVIVIGVANNHRSRGGSIEDARQKVKLALVNPPVDDEGQVTQTCADICKALSDLYVLAFVENGGKSPKGVEERMFSSEDRIKVVSQLEAYLKAIAKKHPRLIEHDDVHTLMSKTADLHGDEGPSKVRRLATRLGLPKPKQ